MKHLLVIALLALATNCIASTNYLAIVIKEDIDKPDKLIGKLGMKEYFNDATEVEWDDLARFCSATDTSVLYRVVCFAIDVGLVQKKDKNKKDIDDWKNLNINEKDKVRIVACGMNPSADLLAAGYKPVTTEIPIP